MGEGIKVEDPLSEADEIKTWAQLSNICRLCAQESEDVVQIFGEEGIALRLPEIISACLPIIVNLCVTSSDLFLISAFYQVSREDALPQVSCRACVSALQNSHILLTTVKEADNNLRKMLVQQTVASGDLPDKVEKAN
jgi:Zinc-finger associated domain (zf-AD)